VGLQKKLDKYSKKICLFAITTSRFRYQDVLQQFYQYRNDTDFHLLLNFYDNDMPPELSNSSTTTFIHGFTTKSSFWGALTRNVVQDYEYVWYMDEDMMFGLNFFPFFQYLHHIRAIKAVISTPKIIRVSEEHNRHQGTWMKEDLGQEFIQVAEKIEVDSFMFVTDAWIYFRENIWIDTPNSCWGPDCFWCKLFNVVTDFGDIACARSLQYGIVHLNWKSLTGSSTFSKDDGIAAIEMYKEHMKELGFVGDQKVEVKCKFGENSETFLDIDGNLIRTHHEYSYEVRVIILESIKKIRSFRFFKRFMVLALLCLPLCIFSVRKKLHRLRCKCYFDNRAQYEKLPENEVEEQVHLRTEK